MMPELFYFPVDSAVPSGGSAPWEREFHELVSWWEMQKFSAHMFYMIAQYLNQVRRRFEQMVKDGEVTRDTVLDTGTDGNTGAKTLTIIRDRCAAIGLTVSVKCANGLIKSGKGTTIGQFLDHFGQLERTIKFEMEDKLFIFIPPDRAAFYDAKESFGKDVNAKFPEIQFDLVEAGNCYAAGRGTAVVFHLMRIMEIGVQRFGDKLGVSFAAEKNWQNILDEINKKMKGLPPKDPQTVMMVEASSNLYAVKLAWRNEVMHPKDTYTLEEADNLIRQVRIFMQQLSNIV
jgi:hypothetical protein